MATYVVGRPWYQSWLPYAVVLVFGVIGFFYVWGIAIDKYCELGMPRPEEDTGIILHNGSEYVCGGIEKDAWNGMVKCTHLCSGTETFNKSEVFVYK